MIRPYHPDADFERACRLHDRARPLELAGRRRRGRPGQADAAGQGRRRAGRLPRRREVRRRGRADRPPARLRRRRRRMHRVALRPSQAPPPRHRPRAPAPRAPRAGADAWTITRGLERGGDRAVRGRGLRGDEGVRRRDRGGGGAVRADGAGSAAQVGFLHRRVRQQVRRVVGQRHLPRLEHVAAVRDLERLVRVLLDEQDRRPLAVDLDDGAEDVGAPAAAPGPATARRAAAGAAAPSARGRWRASAARRRTACRRAASCARRGAGTARTSAPCRRRPAGRGGGRRRASRLSSTVRLAKTTRPSGACEIPARRSRAAGCATGRARRT